MIPVNSPEVQIIADCIEGGGSNEAALLLVNQYRMDNQLPLRGLNQISGLLKRLETISVAVTKGKQGNINADSPWAKARYNWTTQLMVCFGLMAIPEPIPQFDPALLPKYSIYNVVWWDETHQKCIIAGNNGKKKQILFKRNESGAVDLNAGKYNEPATYLNVKYEQEVRFCAGVGVTQGSDRDIGHRLPLFEYANKRIVSISECNELTQKEIQ